MARIDPKKLARYCQIANDLDAGKSLRDSNDRDEKARAFQARLYKEGVDYSSGNFRTTGMYRFPHQKSLQNVDIACVGLPLDRGVPFDRVGTRQGPQALRYWSNSEGGFHETSGFNVMENCSVIDWGDLSFAKSGFDLSENIDEIADLYLDFQKAGVSVFSIGGEHTCTLGILKGLSGNGENPLSLIQLDAHHDTLGTMNGSLINDGSVFRVAVMNGYIDPEKTIQIGVRGRNLMGLEFAKTVGITTITARAAQEQGMASVAEKVHEIVGDSPSYLSICSDVFDVSVMPGTTLPSAFGLMSREVRDLLDQLHSVNLFGADLMEFSPVHDPTASSGALAAAIGYELLTILGISVCRRNSGANRQTVWNKAEV